MLFVRSDSRKLHEQSMILITLRTTRQVSFLYLRTTPTSIGLTSCYLHSKGKQPERSHGLPTQPDKHHVHAFPRV